MNQLNGSRESNKSKLSLRTKIKSYNSAASSLAILSPNFAKAKDTHNKSKQYSIDRIIKGQLSRDTPKVTACNPAMVKPKSSFSLIEKGMQKVKEKSKINKNKSFQSKAQKRKFRSHSQVCNIHSEKTHSSTEPSCHSRSKRKTSGLMYPEKKKVDKLDLKIHLHKNTPSKGLVVTTNGSFINNLNIAPVVYAKQRSEVRKELGGEMQRKSLEKYDPVCIEIASKLELKLKNTVRESDRSSSGRQNKLNIYRSFFKEIIRVDPYFGGLLSKIKDAYENRITELKQLTNRQLLGQNIKWKKLLEEERKKRKEVEIERDTAIQVAKRYRQQIEELKETKQNLQLDDNFYNSHYYPPVKEEPHTNSVRAKPLIPKLDISKVHVQVEESNLPLPNELQSGEDEVMDYHDEFMARADAFSQSWKDALAKERRY